MAYSIAVTNRKGGVAKSTTTVNIADGLMYMNYRVLVIDLDPQCNTTSVFLGRSPKESEKTVFDVFRKKGNTRDCIKHSEFGDIICGSSELSDEEDKYMRAAGGLKIIKKAIKEVSNDYDFIIMDTPPNTGAFMRNALFAANGIITPIQAKRFALDGLTDFLKITEELKEDGNEDLEILGVLLTMYDQRNSQDKEVKTVMPVLLESLGIDMFKTVIRVNQDIEKAISQSRSLFRTKPNSNGANDYANLIAEIMQKINKL